MRASARAPLSLSQEIAQQLTALGGPHARDEQQKDDRLAVVLLLSDLEAAR